MNLEWWWLSYADEDKNEFLGACIIFSETFVDACRVAKRLGLSPGGQVAGHSFNHEAEKKVRLSDVFRLLNKSEATELMRVIDE
jgi:hypothetical protein